MAARVVTAARVCIGGAVGIGGGTTAAALTALEDPLQGFKTFCVIPLRVGRGAVCAATCFADYQWATQGLAAGSAEHTYALRLAHERCANRVVAVCFKNGGVFIKAGQHLGQMDHLLPEEYVNTFRGSLLNRCPASSTSEVCDLIQKDLGAAPSELFASFESQPVASASLAQVHKAVAWDGRALAVKVQHVGLRESGAADTATIAAAAKLLAWVLPDYDYSWVAEETASNLPLELDFEHEAANLQRCAVKLAEPGCRVAGRVAVPEVLHALSSKRILTMTFEDGVQVNDLAGLEQMGADKKEVAALIAETFADMIFRSGDVHCDPHAANMLIRRLPASSVGQSQSNAAADTAPVGGTTSGEDKKHKGALQLVLLDHGLYKQLDDHFRLNYARMWKALVSADEKGIRSAASTMNAGDAEELFAGILTQRPFDEVINGSPDHLRVGSGGEVERERLNEYAQLYAREAARLMQRMPRALLLLLKTNDCLRSVDRELGQPINSFYVTARACTRALAQDRQLAHPGLRSKVSNIIDRLQLEWRLIQFSCVASLLSLNSHIVQRAHSIALALGLAKQQERSIGSPALGRTAAAAT